MSDRDRKAMFVYIAYLSNIPNSQFVFIFFVDTNRNTYKRIFTSQERLEPFPDLIEKNGNFNRMTDNVVTIRSFAPCLM